MPCETGKAPRGWAVGCCTTSTSQLTTASDRAADGRLALPAALCVQEAYGCPKQPFEALFGPLCLSDASNNCSLASATLARRRLLLILDGRSRTTARSPRQRDKWTDSPNQGCASWAGLSAKHPTCSRTSTVVMRMLSFAKRPSNACHSILVQLCEVGRFF